MAQDNKKGRGGLDGILGNLGDLVDKLGSLAEKGEQLSRTGEIKWESDDKELKGVYGLSVKFGIGDQEVKVEPFGNIRKNEASGETVVHEEREPVVDVLEEEGYTLIAAEMPGISREDVRLDLQGDILILSAAKGKKKYRKEILLPKPYSLEDITVGCNNGIVEIKCFDPGTGKK
ncbi:MAG: Hsp20/alpha crystallin family protein [Desulfohalobiaceae bacterium]|nr:Hsp20/alpha crystallin family protein [Desulfohalobiaceae bacterium]